MKISIITIVKNDYRIKTTLEQLEGIKTNHQYEIIVVDASTVNLLEDIRNKFPEDITNYDYLYVTKIYKTNFLPEKQ